MYKLILVDDEDDVKEGIYHEIEWEKYGFEVIGCYGNGKEALEGLDKNLPDIVITDIKMPFMDGLEFAEIVKGKYPVIRIVILTGFDMFEFAQKAIKLNIDEYVLKPFSSQEFVGTLIKVKAQIDEQIAEKENLKTLEKHFRNSLPVLKERFLSSLVTRKLSLQEIHSRTLSYGIKLNDSAFVASAVNYDLSVRFDKSENDEAVNPGGTEHLKMSGDRELLMFAIFNISEEICVKHGRGIVFVYNDNIIVLNSSTEENRDALMHKTLELLEEIRQSIEKYLKVTVTVGVGTVVNSPTDAKLSYDGAVLALDYKLVLGNNRIICIDDVEYRNVEKIEFDELKEQALIRCVKVGTVEELNALIEDLFSNLESMNISFSEYQIFLLEILTLLLRVIRSFSIEMDGFFAPNYNIASEIYKFNNMNEAKKWILDICIRLMGYIAVERKDTCKHLIHDAKEYIVEHFHESDISVNTVSKYLHISTGYFCSIFKREAKMSFVNYLNQLRIEAAKELLRTGDLKSFEVAEKIGFSDPNYFSYCFRKHVGLSPKEYRSSSRGIEKNVC